ncbi:MAG TPA: WG repeat-containing protein [Cytophagaceae bacterium]
MKTVKYLTIAFLIFFIPAVMYGQSKADLKYNEGLAPHRVFDVQKQTALYGFVNEKNKVVINYQFDTVFVAFSKGMAVVSKAGKVGVIDKKGKEIIPFMYKEIGEIDRLIPVKDFKGTWGFYNTAGKKIIDCKYDNFRFAGKGKIIVQELGKWGIISEDGKLLAPLQYKFITWSGGRSYNGVRLNQWEVVTFQNKSVGKFEFDSIRFLDKDLLSYSVIGKYGIINLNGNTITNPYFDKIYPYKNGLAIAQKNDLYGVIDKRGNTVISFAFDQIIIDSLYIRVNRKDIAGSRSDNWGVYAMDGKEVFAPKYRYLKEFSNDLMAASYDGKYWGYVNLKGERVIDFKYAEAGNFHNGLAHVRLSNCKENCMAIINKNGEYVISPGDYKLHSFNLIKIDGLQNLFYKIPAAEVREVKYAGKGYVHIINKEGKHGIVDMEGKQVLPCIYDDIFGPSEELLFVVKSKNKYGIVNRWNKPLLRFNDYINKFDVIYPIHDGYAKVMMKGKYGFINTEGKVLIAPLYTEAGDFHEGLCAVKIKERWGVIDKTEKLIAQPYYEQITNYKNGIAMVKEDGKWNLINKEGRELHQAGYNNITLTDKGFYLLSVGGKYGLAGDNGREILAPRFEEIKILDNGYILVKKDGLWGVVDYKGTIVSSINNERMIYDETGDRLLLGNALKPEQIKVK